VAEVPTIKEKSIVTPLPEVVIPESVRAQFALAIKRIMPLFMDWNVHDECWVDSSVKPDLIITLARAGSLAWVPMAAIADLYDIRLPKTFDLHLGRELAYRFIRESQGDFRLLQNGDAKTIADFKKWLDKEFNLNPDLAEAIANISESLAANDKSKNIVVFDDVVQDCITMGIIIPRLIERSLATNVTFVSSNEKLQKRLAIRDLSSEIGQTTKVTLECILDDTEWLYGIIDNSFSEYFDSLYLEKKIVVRQLLVQLAKGSIEDIQTGALNLITNEAQIRKIGENIQQQYLTNNAPRHEAMFIDPGNPADEILETYGVTALLTLQIAVREELERLGQTVEL